MKKLKVRVCGTYISSSEYERNLHSSSCKWWKGRSLLSTGLKGARAHDDVVLLPPILSISAIFNFLSAKTRCRASDIPESLALNLEPSLSRLEMGDEMGKRRGPLLSQSMAD